MTSGDPRTLESPGAITPAPSARWNYAVVARDLVKTYPRPGGGSLNAVAGLSFEVRHGEIFGLLGPNGGPERPPPSRSSRGSR